MNETKEKEVYIDEKLNQESDLDNFFKGTYRRGARRKTKGNFTLFIVVAILAIIVIAGIVLVIKTFMPVDTKKDDSQVKVNLTEALNDNEESYLPEFKEIVNSFTKLNSKNIIEKEDGEKLVFKAGILNHCQLDFDNDGTKELFTVTSNKEFMPEFSVYEEDGSSAGREAYYVYAKNLVSEKENAKSEIYISQVAGENYICIEKYCFDDFSWSIEILSYDGGFKSLVKRSFSSDEEVDDEFAEELEAYGIEYTLAHYSEASELKMNGDVEEGKILLCSFETRDGKLNSYIR